MGHGAQEAPRSKSTLHIYPRDLQSDPPVGLPLSRLPASDGDDGDENVADLPGTHAEATREEMRDANLPIQYRDSCAHLLIPLNRCRSATYYLPWKCEDERHSYEKCQYDEFKLRVAKMDELRAAKGGVRSN
ncbi:hypothetical protein RB594_008885 [Gaeumannomyces avenae]